MSLECLQARAISCVPDLDCAVGYREILLIMRVASPERFAFLRMNETAEGNLLAGKTSRSMVDTLS